MGNQGIEASDWLSSLARESLQVSEVGRRKPRGAEFWKWNWESGRVQGRGPERRELRREGAPEI